MSINNNNDREASNLYEVVSEYFRHHLVMDESCITNKKEKRSTTETLGIKSHKGQGKPRTKRLRGQKDIRTLIKLNKNELVTYSKDFDLICKHAGINIDPEQLQLSIALSKSLQDSNPISLENSTAGKTLTSQERKRKIRSTLQEYGFKIPEVKFNLNKKTRKYRKKYKLLLVSDTEKKQVIADKYAQILFRNGSVCELSDKSQFKCQNINSDLFNLSTNISYDCIKNNEVFYVNNLVEKSVTKRHHMLKDWSEIPGRPISPKLELPDIHFDNIEFSQEELAFILSGTIDSTQDIVERKYKSTKNSKVIKKNIDNLNIHPKVSDLSIKYKDCDIELKGSISEKVSTEDNFENSCCRTVYEKSQEMSLPKHRGCSPDLFDDEVTIIMDSSKDKTTMEEHFSTKSVVREQIHFMDLTECVNIVNYNTADTIQDSYVSQGLHKTRMIQDDFMDLTGCVTSTSQKMLSNQPNTLRDASETETMDLTLSPKLNDNSLIKQHNKSDNKSLDDTIIIIDNDYFANSSDRKSVKLVSNESDIIDLVGDQTILNNRSPNITEEYGSNCEFDNLLNNIPSSIKKVHYGNVNKVNDNSFQENEGEIMDLSQTSDSENCLYGEKKLDGVLDRDHYSNHVADSSLKESIYSNTVHKKSIKTRLDTKRNLDFDSDRECDFVIENVSKNIQNTTQGSYLCENHIINGENPDGERHPNLIHHSGCSKNKNNSKDIEIRDILKNVDDNDYYICNVISYNNEKSADEKDIVVSKRNNIKEISTCKNNSYHSIHGEKYQTSVDHENDREFDSLLDNLTKSKKSIVVASKSYEDESFSFKHDSTFAYDSNLRKREIDLTQYSDCLELVTCSTKVISDTDELGKRNNISIDYDEVYEEKDNNKYDKTFEYPEVTNNSFVEKNKCLSEAIVSGSSQNYEQFEISGNEYNYSIDRHKEESRLIKLDRNSRFDIGGMSSIEGLLNQNEFSPSKLRSSCSSLEANSNEYGDNSCLPKFKMKTKDNLLGEEKEESGSCMEGQSEKKSTPLKSRSTDDNVVVQTPLQNDYIIKTDQVTPMPNYEGMTSPEREQELDKYGIKPLKRKRAIQILTHIYNQTHPIMQIISESEGCSSPYKVRKHNYVTTFPRRSIVSEIKSIEEKNAIQLSKPSLNKVEPLSQKSTLSRQKLANKSRKSPTQKFKSIEDVNKENNIYNAVTQLPDIRNIECGTEDWIFQKREKAKVHSCRVPLHIAFHNYVSSRRLLKEAILKYEPIRIDDIRKGLVSNGYRYNAKDIMRFMDKKCITIKTADKTRNNKKKHVKGIFYKNHGID